MLRPRKKHTVFDLQQLKGQRVLTHIHIKSPEEAAAAEEAGVDLMSCSFDSPEAQARLPALVAAAPHSFLSCATPHGLASPEEAIRVAFRALELGASSVYCSASPLIIEAMARERIPVVGHLGLVPRHVTWTGYRAIGRTVEEATQLYHRMKELENAGAYAAELEVVPHNLARFLSSQTKMLLMSLGSGPGCDTQFLFSDDILGDYDERPPRHAKAYRDFAAEHRRLQQERLAAFREYVADTPTSARTPHSTTAHPPSMQRNKPTGLMGAARPQTPRRSPRQAFGGNRGPMPPKPRQSPPTKTPTTTKNSHSKWIKVRGHARLWWGRTFRGRGGCGLWCRCRL